MFCPSCGAQTSITDCRNITHQYKGQVLTIFNVQGDFCQACGESVLGVEETKRVSAEMVAFNKKVNEQWISPAFISNVRKKLNLDQQQAAKFFGGGVNAFSRYETGKTKPPLALIQLFKLLDKHPELLPELSA